MSDQEMISPQNINSVSGKQDLRIKENISYIKIIRY